MSKNRQQRRKGHNRKEELTLEHAAMTFTDPAAEVNNTLQRMMLAACENSSNESGTSFEADAPEVQRPNVAESVVTTQELSVDSLSPLTNSTQIIRPEPQVNAVAPTRPQGRSEGSTRQTHLATRSRYGLHRQQAVRDVSYRERLYDKHVKVKLQHEELKKWATKAGKPIPHVTVNSEFPKILVKLDNIMWKHPTQEKHWVTITLDRPNYVDILPQQITLLLDKKKLPLHQFDNPEFGMQFTLVAQCECWYPQRDVRMQLTGVWCRRPVWGPGIFNFSSGGSFELGDEKVLKPHEKPPIQLPDLQYQSYSHHFKQDYVHIIVNLAIVPWAPKKPAPIWATVYRRPPPLGMYNALCRTYGVTSHEDLPPNTRMSLSIRLPAKVYIRGTFNWWELSTRVRAHNNNDGIPLAVDATEARDLDCRTWLGYWIGSVLPFDTRDNSRERLPRRAPLLGTLDRRLLALEADRKLARERPDTLRAEGDDVPRSGPLSDVCIQLSELSIGAHVPEEDVEG